MPPTVTNEPKRSSEDQFMDNADTTPQTGPSQENSSVAEAFQQPVPPLPASSDEQDLKLLKRVNRAFHIAADLLDREAESQFHVVASRTWAEWEIISCDTVAALQDCMGKLRDEVYARHRARQPGDIRIYVFHGVRVPVAKMALHRASTRGALYPAESD